jgi:hypothetical protein
MLHRVITTLAALALIGGFLAGLGGTMNGADAAPVSAATPGSGPDTPLPIPSGPATVALGQRVWFGFQYAGDGSQILIRMNATPGGSARFSVWTPSNVRSWAAGGGENPVGRGSPQTVTRVQADGTVEESSLYGGDLIWSGNFRSPSTYYVVVDQTGPAPATITLEVSGSGVWAILGAAAQAPAPVASPTPARGASVAAACTPVAPPKTLAAGGPGSAPDRALALPAQGSFLLSAGQRAWFAFQYSGDGSQILIDLRATPDNSAEFAVYPTGNTTTPVGRGSQQITHNVLADGTVEERPLYGGDLIWSGSFRSPGTGYVTVDQAGPNPSTITLGISGRGVSGGQAASALPSSIQPGSICVTQPAAAPAPVTVPASGPGGGPDQALPLPSDRDYVLIEGQRAWFAFQYSGDGSQILIIMHAMPEDSAQFEVYAPGNTAMPVGRGSQQTKSRRLADGTVEETTLFGGDLIWSGSFRSPGTCYVRVVQSDPRTSTIRLAVSGSGVSVPPPR